MGEYDSRRPLRRGRLGRAAPLAAMAGRTAGASIVRSLRKRPGTAEFHEREADRYADFLGGSRGVLMKAGQILSFTSLGGLTGEYESVYQRALARLQDSAPPMPATEAAAVIEAELGAPPDRVFAAFDPEPIAAASIGQVHSARTHDGRRVAVKVQYPGVDEAIRADLANSELLVTFFQLARGLVPDLGGFDVRAMAAEVAVRIGDEIDYRVEAANQRAFAAAHRDDPLIRVPEVLEDLSTGRVLTMEFATGRRFADAVTAPAELRDSWGEAIYRFAVGSPYTAGLFHADPHPGNYLFHDDGTVSFLDFGSVRRFTPAQVATLHAVSAAVYGDDPDVGVLALAGMGIRSGAGYSAAEIMAWFRIGWENSTGPQPFTFTAEHAAEVIRRKFALTGPEGGVLRSMSIDADYLMLIRVDLGVTSVLGALGATADWRALERRWERARTGEAAS